MTQDGMRLRQFQSTRLLKNKTCLICRQKQMRESLFGDPPLAGRMCARRLEHTNPSALRARSHTGSSFSGRQKRNWKYSYASLDVIKQSKTVWPMQLDSSSKTTFLSFQDEIRSRVQDRVKALKSHWTHSELLGHLIAIHGILRICCHMDERERHLPCNFYISWDIYSHLTRFGLLHGCAISAPPSRRNVNHCTDMAARSIAALGIKL